MRFKNLSQFEQFGVAPGESGEANLTQDEADRKVASGAIELQDGDTPAPAPEETGEVVDPAAAEGNKTPEEIEAETKAAAEAAEAEKQAEDQTAQSRGRRGR